MYVVYLCSTENGLLSNHHETYMVSLEVHCDLMEKMLHCYLLEGFQNLTWTFIQCIASKTWMVIYNKFIYME